MESFLSKFDHHAADYVTAEKRDRGGRETRGQRGTRKQRGREKRRVWDIVRERGRQGTERKKEGQRGGGKEII